MKTVQQSGSGSIEVSKVPMRRARAMASVLSKVKRGRSTGRPAASSIQVMFSRVWLATWPRDSPVIKAPALSRRAMEVAMRCMKRR